jgi:glycosyltransferase involved in cell wall biosynthesis
VPFGVRPPTAATREAALGELRRRLRGLERFRILLFYSRFHSVKGILELLDAFVALSRSHPDWHLLAVGQPEEYSVDQLEARASDLGLSGRVTVLDGRGLPAPYPLAELFVLPSRHESYGAVVAEALAFGVPVVATTGTPWKQLAAIGAGRCVDPDQLSVTLGDRMSESRESLAEAGRRGSEWATRERDWGVAARVLSGFYRSILTR